jgi:hypothetical protein
MNIEHWMLNNDERFSLILQRVQRLKLHLYLGITWSSVISLHSRRTIKLDKKTYSGILYSLVSTTEELLDRKVAAPV